MNVAPQRSPELARKHLLAILNEKRARLLFIGIGLACLLLGYKAIN